jgi:hypothetical protein
MLPRRVLVEYWGWLTIVVVPVLVLYGLFSWLFS